MKIKTKLKTVFAIALATFCVGSAQAKEIQLSVANWPDKEMRNSLQTIAIQAERYDRRQLEENDWRVKVEDDDYYVVVMVMVEMQPDGQFNYSEVSLDAAWDVARDGDVIMGMVKFNDVIEIPVPARRAHAVTWDASSANATVEVRAKIPEQDTRSNFESGTKFPVDTLINFTVMPNEGYGYVSTPEGWEANDVRDDVILCIEKAVAIQDGDVNVEIPVATKIVTPGSEENPWKIGAGADPNAVTAWTNGAEFVVQGEGTIANLSSAINGWDDFAGGLTAIKIADPTVTGAAADAFAGIGGSEPLLLTLPDGWQGELPDAGRNWYGAKVELMAMPLAVRNVKKTTHWPWDGKIDVTCDLTGAGKVQLGVALTTNGVTVCTATPANLTGVTEIALDAAGGETNGVKFTWNAKADCPADFNSTDTKVKVTAKK